jgi:phosphate starvation-inducible PhoH-like protein
LYQPSGLILAREILSGVSGIAFCEFSELDVVRHPIVQEVIRAYECYERKKRGESIRESLHVEQK